MIKEALRIALRELPNHIESRRHWSFIIQKGQIVEWAKNRLGEPTGMYFAGYQPGRHGLHSEVVAFQKARGLLDTRKEWGVINIRLDYSGKTVISTPCTICYAFLKACGCTKFIYTDITGQFVKTTPLR